MASIFEVACLFLAFSGIANARYFPNYPFSVENMRRVNHRYWNNPPDWRYGSIPGLNEQWIPRFKHDYFNHYLDSKLNWEREDLNSITRGKSEESRDKLSNDIPVNILSRSNQQRDKSSSPNTDVRMRSATETELKLSAISNGILISDATSDSNSNETNEDKISTPDSTSRIPENTKMVSADSQNTNLTETDLPITKESSSSKNTTESLNASVYTNSDEANKSNFSTPYTEMNSTEVENEHSTDNQNVSFSHITSDSFITSSEMDEVTETVPVTETSSVTMDKTSQVDEVNETVSVTETSSVTMDKTSQDPSTDHKSTSQTETKSKESTSWSKTASLTDVTTEETSTGSSPVFSSTVTSSSDTSAQTTYNQEDSNKPTKSTENFISSIRFFDSSFVSTISYPVTDDTSTVDRKQSTFDPKTKPQSSTNTLENILGEPDHVIESSSIRTLKIVVSVVFLVIAFVATSVLITFVIKVKRQEVQYDQLTLLP